jgi:CBS domain-containing protein
MGTMDVSHELEGGELRSFTRRLLADLRALETMINEGMVESGVRRVGAEQEMFIVDGRFRPAMCSLEALKRIDDEHYTTELGLFNLECNLDPYVFGGDCLSLMEGQLHALLGMAETALEGMGLAPVLIGSLPTMRKGDLGLDSMTPVRRYGLLAQALDRLRGGTFEFHIKGIDDLIVQHDNVMLESCNASFQAHFQVGPEEFANLYNIAQIATAPVMAVAANSPLLFGKRLWAETRIALFQQSIDTRRSAHHIRERSPRVMFGNGWVRESVMELYKEDVARFEALMGGINDEDPFEALAAGRVPKLHALTLHNSTVYRWNRACYGQTNGVPHLRIENRVMPSGPTPADEVANAAFWFGLISRLSHVHGDIRSQMDFDDARTNFRLAARQGMRALFTWMDGKTYPAQQLIGDVLLPIAEQGLREAKIDRADIDKYLGIIDRRAATGQNGSRWQLASLSAMGERGSTAERMAALVGATVARQKEDKPVSEWELAGLEEGGGWALSFSRVEQYMTTDVFTVRAEEAVELVANLMIWEHIRHVPVEDADHNLVGMVSYRALIKLIAGGQLSAEDVPIPVSQVMHTDLITCGPKTRSLEAIRIMRDHKVGALPVVKDGQLVGVVTQHDFIEVARSLLEDRLLRLEAEEAEEAESRVAQADGAAEAADGSGDDA